MNETTLIGNLTRDPQLRHSETGTSVCTFSVAVNTDRRDGERDTVFMPVIAFGKQGHNCFTSLKKGSRVIVIGRIEKRKWNDTWEVQLVAEHVAASLQFTSMQPGQQYNHESETARLAKSLGMVWDGENWIQNRPERSSYV